MPSRTSTNANGISKRSVSNMSEEKREKKRKADREAQSRNRQKVKTQMECLNEEIRYLRMQGGPQVAALSQRNEDLSNKISDLEMENAKLKQKIIDIEKLLPNHRPNSGANPVNRLPDPYPSYDSSLDTEYTSAYSTPQHHLSPMPSQPYDVRLGQNQLMPPQGSMINQGYTYSPSPLIPEETWQRPQEDFGPIEPLDFAEPASQSEECDFLPFNLNQSQGYGLQPIPETAAFSQPYFSHATGSQPSYMQ